jgi:hypothetical protein
LIHEFLVSPEAENAGLGLVSSDFRGLYCTAALDFAAHGSSDLNGRSLQCRVSTRSRQNAACKIAPPAFSLAIFLGFMVD